MDDDGVGGVDDGRNIDVEDDSNDHVCDFVLSVGGGIVDDVDDVDDVRTNSGAFGTINVGVICKPCQNTGFGSFFSFVFLVVLVVVVPVVVVVLPREGVVGVETTIPSSKFAKFRKLSVMVKNVCCKDIPLRPS